MGAGMAFADSSPASRLTGALAAIAVQALIVLALLLGLRVAMPPGAAESLKLFAVPPDRPPPPHRIEPAPRKLSRPEGEAAPPNLRSEATPVVAPPPLVVVTRPPPPIVAAPVPAEGAQASSGASDRPGPGTGAGGIGNGRGSGGSGDGDGSGEGTPPRLRRGEIRDSDYPASAAELGVGGVVGVRYLVWTDGRVRDCRIDRSSGNAALDEATCRLIEERFRFDPARDGDGEPEPAYLVENHEWVLERVPAEPPPPRRRR
jgi:protein TonB